MSLPMLTRGRPNDEKPFCWQSKRALERIHDCPAVTKFSTALAVYTALTWLASDESSESFKAEISAIARRSGLGYRTVQDVLPQLEQAGVITVNRPPIRAAATFTILSPVRQPLPNDTQPPPSVRQMKTAVDCRTLSIINPIAKTEASPAEKAKLLKAGFQEASRRLQQGEPL